MKKPIALGTFTSRWNSGTKDLNLQTYPNRKEIPNTWSLVSFCISNWWDYLEAFANTIMMFILLSNKKESISSINSHLSTLSLHLKNYVWKSRHYNILKMNLSTKIFFKKWDKVEIKSFRVLTASSKESRKFLVLSLLSIRSMISLIHQLLGSCSVLLAFFLLFLSSPK